jgi:pimeloyl-ACP methyl ester carboxylesterase
LVAAVVAALVCAGAAAAVHAATRSTGATTQELTITVSDQTKLACGLVLPGSSPPAGGWPGLILFHGLGQNHQYMEAIAQAAFAPVGFASLACDARGTGASGGAWGLDGPKEVQDARDLFDWLAARGDVSNTQIGAFGLSLGGGAVWNAAAGGVPFKAIVPAITWTDLGQALNPDGVPKTGLLAILAGVVPLDRWDPALAQIRDTLLRNQVTSAVKSSEAARSSRSRLHRLKVPTLLLQGRHDFLFDMSQAIAAWKLLAGPKRLYFGDLGHAPAKNPAVEQAGYITEATAWFGHYLAGGPAIPGGIELAHDPWDGTTSVYKKLPATRTASVNFPGTKRLSGAAFATRSARLTGGPHETFGAGYVRVRYSGAKHWTHLVATVLVKGRKTPVTEGGAPIKSASGVVKIPLMNEAVVLPRGKRLVIRLGFWSSDNVNHVGTPIYNFNGPVQISIKLENATLRLSFLKHMVSK